jgi:hypothetical protein
MTNEFWDEERDASDAPPEYRADEARAWAAGYNAALAAAKAAQLKTAGNLA